MGPRFPGVLLADNLVGRGPRSHIRYKCGFLASEKETTKKCNLGSFEVSFRAHVTRTCHI